MASKNSSLKPSSVPVSRDAKYLSKLSVFGKGDELSQPTTTKGFELRACNSEIYDQTICDKVKAALKVLTLGVQYALVQFWSPHIVGKHHQLTTIDRPFGFGVCDERLISYRRDSECKIYDVNKDYDEEEDISPLVRVFRQGLPVMSLDVTHYLPKHFPQQECAIRCNLHGYLALPVFDPITRLCVGVLELLTSSTSTSLCYEVEQIQKALKEQDLISTNVNATFTDVGERSSYLKQCRKRKRSSDNDTMVLVRVTYAEDIKCFRFPISLGQLSREKKVLLKLKREVAKRFKLTRLMNYLKLKYTDEENDLILIGVDKDLELAMVASGSINCMNLICKLSA